MTSQETVLQPHLPLTRVSFCICADAFSPENLTDLLQLSPSAAWRKGEPRRDRGENRYYAMHPDVAPGFYPFSHWRYSTPYEEAADIMKPISRILETLLPRRDILLRAKETHSLRYQICINIKRGKSDASLILPGMILSPSLIAFADGIGAEISLDLTGLMD